MNVTENDIPHDGKHSGEFSLRRALLTIAIPTYNRAHHLEALLCVLMEQAEMFRSGLIELVIGDNHSTDLTPSVIEKYQSAGLPIRHLRHSANIGSDANFAFCYENSSGKYFWLCGDDDILVPPDAHYKGALPDLVAHLQQDQFDLVYVTSYGFRKDWRAERRNDPLNRDYHVIPNARQVARVINVMLTFVSGIVIHRDKLEQLCKVHSDIEPPSAFVGTNLVQLSWTLPLLRFHTRSLILWRRPVACFTGGRGGYSFGAVFGERLVALLQRVLFDRPDLQRVIINASIRKYVPSSLIAMRFNPDGDFQYSEAERALKHAYGRNFRFWIFIWPVLKLPKRAAIFWQQVTAAFCKLLYALEVPGFWRKKLGQRRVW